MTASLALAEAGLVVALKAEHRAAALSGLPVVSPGMGAERARQGAQALISKGVGALVSFGVAGGLNPELVTGTLLVPSQLHWHGAVFHTDRVLSARLRHLAGAQVVTVCAPHLAVENMVTDSESKCHLASTYGAAGLDMESGVVAEVAAMAAVPFIIVRAICDDAKTSLPPAIATLLRDSGELRLLRAAAAVLCQPVLLSELIALSVNFRQALGTLRHTAQAIGADLNRRRGQTF